MVFNFPLKVASIYDKGPDSPNLFVDSRGGYRVKKVKKTGIKKKS